MLSVLGNTQIAPGVLTSTLVGRLPVISVWVCMIRWLRGKIWTATNVLNDFTIHLFSKRVCVWYVFHLYLPEAVRAAQDTEVSIGRHFGVCLTAQNDGGYRKDCEQRKRTPFITCSCFQVKTLHITKSKDTLMELFPVISTHIKYTVISSSNWSNANLLTWGKIRAVNSRT